MLEIKIIGLATLIVAIFVLKVIFRMNDLKDENAELKEFIASFVDQERVDNILSRSARLLGSVCQEEIQFRHNTTGMEADILMNSLTEYQIKIQTYKGYFWKKAEAAKKQKFTIRKSYKDYLPEAQETQVV